MDTARPPFERLRALVHAFTRSECEEATVRIALSDAAPLYRDAAEAIEARASGDQAIKDFMREVLPELAAARRRLAGDLVMTTLSQVGKEFSGSKRTPSEMKTYADAIADMLGAYIQALKRN